MTLYKQGESPSRTKERVAQVFLAAIFVVLLNPGQLHTRPTPEPANQFACESLTQHNLAFAAGATGDAGLLVDETDDFESRDSHAMVLFARSGLFERRNSRLLVFRLAQWTASSFFLRTSNKLFRP